MNDALQKATDLATTITNTLIAKAPATYNLIIETYKFQAINQLVVGLITLIIAIPIFWKTYKYFTAFEDITDSNPFLATPAMIMMFPLVANLPGLFSVFNWIGIWRPEIYIAHQLIDKVMN